MSSKTYHRKGINFWSREMRFFAGMVSAIRYNLPKKIGRISTTIGAKEGDLAFLQ